MGRTTAGAVLAGLLTVAGVHLAIPRPALRVRRSASVADPGGR